MFLVCTSNLSHIIKCVLCFIENNSVLVGGICSVIVGSLWLRKFLKQKRAEAMVGFYERLSLRLKTLQTSLDENGRLNINQPKAGNIYSLIYAEGYIKEACPGFAPLNRKELNSYKAAASELKKILLETENNVYPSGATREEWHESQQILFSFCDFLENNEFQHITNEQISDGETKPKHIAKCESLIKAMNYIQEAINNIKY